MSVPSATIFPTLSKPAAVALAAVPENAIDA